MAKSFKTDSVLKRFVQIFYIGFIRFPVTFAEIFYQNFGCPGSSPVQRFSLRKNRFILGTMRKFIYLGCSGNLKPSNDQAIDGVGFPDALHLSETVGPGCSVCSMNVYSMVGGASGKQNYNG